MSNPNSRLKILVVEDNPANIGSARDAFKDHDLVVATSFDEAMKALSTGVDHNRLEQLRAEAGLGVLPQGGTADEREAWWSKDDELRAKARNHPDFDVVLTDMNLPMSEFKLAPEWFKAGEQVPYGFVLALRACLVGVKFVAMVTDTNHHHGAMSAALDLICPASSENRETNGFNKAMTINGSTCMFMHAPLLRHGGSPKDWGQALKCLLAGSYVR